MIWTILFWFGVYFFLGLFSLGVEFYLDYKKYFEGGKVNEPIVDWGDMIFTIIFWPIFLICMTANFLVENVIIPIAKNLAQKSEPKEDLKKRIKELENQLKQQEEAQ